MKDLPAIVKAARAASVVDAALLYSQLGMSVIPCIGKRASVSYWRDRQKFRADIRVISDWHRAGLLQNVAIVCGMVSSNLVVIDLDGERACDLFAMRFPELVDTYTVASGSGKGRHLYFYADTLPITTRLMQSFGNIELRANGCYVVAPPSIHPSGKPYRVENPLDILHVAHLDDVARWLIKQRAPQSQQKSVEKPRHVSRWAEGALRHEANNVRFSSPGSQNNTLNRAAFKLGQLVADNHLAREIVEAALYEAARELVNRDGEMSVRRTIKSGLDAGIANPRRRRA